MGFLSNRQPEDSETLPHRLRPQYESVYSEKIAIFTRRVPVENIKTLKTWLWVFSATDNLRNLKLYHIDYSPNMSLWDDFSQNRRPKVFSEKIAIFTRRVPVENVETLKTWLWVFSATEIGRAHVWTPVTRPDLVCRLLLEKKKKNTQSNAKIKRQPAKTAPPEPKHDTT